MRRALLVGLFACVVIAANSSSTASAQSLDTIFTNKQSETETADPQHTKTFDVIEVLGLAPKVEEKPVEAAPVAPQPTVHTVGANDTLSSIAQQYSSDWKRIYFKNASLVSPDVLTVGTQLVIPAADEQLAERALPEPPAPAPAPVAAAKPQATKSYTYSRGSSNGNTYAPGYCTWYAKNMRPDLPNNLGNAETWVSRAAAQGIPTGSVPQAGAIGQRGNHVVYVERVNSDGTIFISEMNYSGLYQVSTRTVPANYFQYIY